MINIKKEDIEKSNSWPFVEAKKILKERKKNIDKKGKIILQTGYGPSGLPHIGTFGEVARTSMVVNALNYLTELPKEIITFSDDLDGLRKVPDNIPNKDILKKIYISLLRIFLTRLENLKVLESIIMKCLKNF